MLSTYNDPAFSFDLDGVKPHEKGMMAAVGDPNDPQGLVSVCWCKDGSEFALLDCFKVAVSSKALILVNCDATPAEVAEFHRRHKKSWRFGNCFMATRAILSEFDAINGAIDAEYKRELHEEARQVAKTTKRPRAAKKKAVATHGNQKAASRKKSAPRRRKAA